MTSQILNSPLAFVAIQAALKAGHLLRRGFGTRFSINSKANAQDLVTDFDKIAEETIISFIRQHFPDHAFLAEESGESGVNQSPFLWIIDPLDGTMNFAHHIPLFTVSIAVSINSRVEIGVIYQPMTEELFTVQRGRGAYLNGTRLEVSQIADMQNAVGATGFPYDINYIREKYLGQFVNFLNVGNPIRIIGSACLNLAYVAAGRFDVYWGTYLQPWDIAAGKLLVEEAGGKVTHFDGTKYETSRQPDLVATNRILHPIVLNFLK
jgi:myo-inositol-1(or 4)-monophosphatase